MRALWLDLGWLVVLVITWLGGAAGARCLWEAHVLTSLLLWLIPIVYLWPLFHTITADGTGRRRAWSVSIRRHRALGTVLDFLIGRRILTFQCLRTKLLAQSIRWQEGWSDCEAEQWFITFATMGRCVEWRWKAEATVHPSRRPSRTRFRPAQEMVAVGKAVLSALRPVTTARTKRRRWGTINGFAIHPDVVAVAGLTTQDHLAECAAGEWGVTLIVITQPLEPISGVGQA
jgi:hypothetical protein